MQVNQVNICASWLSSAKSIFHLSLSDIRKAIKINLRVDLTLDTEIVLAAEHKNVYILSRRERG